MSSEQKVSTKVELFTWCVKKMFEKKLWTEILNSSCEQKMWIVVGVFVVVVDVVVVVVIVVIAVVIIIIIIVVVVFMDVFDPRNLPLKLR